MGTMCSTPSPKQKEVEEDAVEESNLTEEDLVKIFHGTELHFLPFKERRAQLEEWLTEIQKHHRERLRKEMVADLHGFILNNLLLCVQFYKNFDNAIIGARNFKEKTEAEMTEKLAPLVEDGMILGERKCFLLHGMGNQLIQSYIYKDDGHLRRKLQDSTGTSGKKKQVSIALDNAISFSDEPRNTFTSDSIIPLDFIITWDNLEVYKESEWDGLREYQYSSANGSPSICRVCMEETDGKNQIPRGYVRLRVVDTPLSMRPIHPLPISASPQNSVGYAAGHYSPVDTMGDYNEKVEEVRTDSDLNSTTNSQNEESSEYSVAFSNGDHFLSHVKRRVEAFPNLTSNDSSGTASPFLQVIKSKDSSKLYQNQFKTSGELYNAGSETTHPLSSNYNSVMDELFRKPVRLKASSHRTSKSTSERVVAPSQKEKHPKQLQKNGESKISGTKTLKNSRNQENDSLITPTPPPQSQTLLTLAKASRTLEKTDPLSSSGYESTPIPLPPKEASRSSSASLDEEQIHLKWKHVELKKLWQFTPKRREKSREPLSRSCFQTIKVEVESEEDEAEDESEEEETSDTEDTSSEASDEIKKKVVIAEPAYVERTYLSSLGFSADFCSEFKQLGTQMDMDDGALRGATVLGTTIQCSVWLKPDKESSKPATSKMLGNPKSSESFHMLHTWTPSLHSKSWPQKPLIWWKRRIMREAWDGTERWPTREQAEKIEQAGCNLIPIGSRSVLSTQSENVEHSLVWSVGFSAAENILLDSLLHVQWRCLTYACLIFRAFIAPLGPLGVGLEHIRNILYFMCHEEFVSWNYEQPGLHLKSLLDKVYDSLGRGDMPSFFVAGHNLFKNIPIQNLRKVQANLSKVRDNLLFHTMFMLRNLVQMDKDFYPMPKDNFKKLYDYLTVPEKQILYLVNPNLKGITTEDLKKDGKSHKRKKKDKSRISHELLMSGELIDKAYENKINKGVPKIRPVDVEQKRFRKKRDRWLEKQRIIKEEEAEKARIAAEALKLPQQKKNSIDLEESPIKQREFSAQRLGLVLKYFIKQFIKMAAKSYEYKSYAQASMYTQHTENLISLLCDLPNEEDSPETEKFKENAKGLRETIGAHMADYIQEKISRLESSRDEDYTQKTYDQITGLLTKSSKSGPFSSNWNLRTQVPHSSSEVSLHGRSTTSIDNSIRLNTKGLADSLAGLSVSQYNFSEYGGDLSGFQIPRLSERNYKMGSRIRWKSNPTIARSGTFLYPGFPQSKLGSDSGTLNFQSNL